jgi:hypothetical protein
MTTVTVRRPPSGHVYIRGGEAVYGYDNSTKEHTYNYLTRCIQPIPVLPSASRESVGDQASEIAIRRETLARVCGRSYFWGAYSRLLASSARPALIKFLVAGVVHGMALCTFACVDCVRLHRTYTRDVSCE